MRRYAREVVFCRIYEYLFTSCDEHICGDKNPVEVQDKQPSREIDGEMFKLSDLSESDIAYIEVIYSAAVQRLGSYKDTVAKLLRGFTLGRIRAIELSLFITAMAEFDAGDAPHAVVISEVVDLSKKYSGEKSAKFINGLLAEHLKRLESKITNADEA